MSPHAESRLDPELHIRFGYDEERQAQREAYAASFCAFWRDQFGTVHFVATDDEEWSNLFDKIEANEIGTFEVDEE